MKSYAAWARAVRALALLATTGTVWLAATGHWITAALLAWMVPSLVVLGGRLRAAHRHTTHEPRKRQT